MGCAGLKAVAYLSSPKSHTVAKLCAHRTSKAAILSYRILEGGNLPIKKWKSMCQGDSMSTLSKFELPHHTENSLTTTLTKELGRQPGGGGRAYTHPSVYYFMSLSNLPVSAGPRFPSRAFHELSKCFMH